MKTTVEVPDDLYCQVKALAALKGQTIKAFFLEALREKLGATAPKPRETAGWRTVFGKVDKEEMAELLRIVDEGSSQINPEDRDAAGSKGRS